MQPAVADPETAGRLTEACTVDHAARFHPTHYIKAAGEVDLAYVAGRGFWPLIVRPGTILMKSAVVWRF